MYKFEVLDIIVSSVYFSYLIYLYFCIFLFFVSLFFIYFGFRVKDNSILKAGFICFFGSIIIYNFCIFVLLF